MDGDSCNTNPDTLGQICCGGYVFNMSDGSRFRRLDVEPVEIGAEATKQGSRLQTRPRDTKKRKYNDEYDVEDGPLQEPLDNSDDVYFHICGTEEEDVRPVTSIHFGERCASWLMLSDDQKKALIRLRAQVDADRCENSLFTCAIVEGPGGCGKTRLMAHLMNHSHANTPTLYVTKQNKRVQDFVHTDCLSGEPDPTVQKPIDLTGKRAYEIRHIIERFNDYVTGRFAVTAEKLIYAIASLSPRAFDTNATACSLGIEYDAIKGRSQQNDHKCAAPTTVKGDSDRRDNTATTIKRNVILLIDEYTMLQPPLIHAIVYYVRRVTGSPIVVVLGGDRLQCGPVGWNDKDMVGRLADKQYYTADVRNEFVHKIGYTPLELTMDNIQRCRGDPALGACIRRLRRVCDEQQSSFDGRNTVNRVLAMYCAETGVNMYRKETGTNGLSSIRKIVPADGEALDECQPSKDFDERMMFVDEEDLDTRSIEFALSAQEPIRPMYDLLPLVRHYTDLFVRLAVIDITRPNSANDLWPNVVRESVNAVRNMFPVVLVLTNSLCNVFAETFLLALSTKVRECVLNAPMPSQLGDKILPQFWTGHLRYTLRRCIRSLTIDKDDAIQRQTLFLGMAYKMTSTMNAADCATSGLCNGEIVVLTNIVFDSNTLERIHSVMLRKLDRNMSDDDLVMYSGLNENRMTGAKKVGIMPFVPYVSENIYQMQGNTIGRKAKTFVDLANVPCKSAYVAVSRFQDSASILGIVIAD